MASVGTWWASHLDRQFRSHTQSPYAWRKFIRAELARFEDQVENTPRNTQPNQYFNAAVNVRIFQTLARVTDRACRRRDREMRRRGRGR